MKKYLYLALAMPMMFACSSDDLLEKGAVSNDQFSGIEKVDATFTMDEGQGTRMDKGSWEPEAGDLWGFAWMGEGTKVPITGDAFQNHNLIQKSNYFEPQTSIYVGNYFIYRPYDKTTVSPQAINFKSLEEQPLAEGYESEKQPWKDLAKTAINIGDRWTVVDADGWYDATDKRTYDNAGIKKYYKLYAAMFSNQTGLDLTYVKNNPTFAAAATITGATDINYPIAAGTEVGSADIYEATVNLNGQAKSFTYAPTASPNGTSHSGTFWADKSGTSTYKVDNTNGFTFTAGAVKLVPADATNGLSTGTDGSKAWFWFNSLPVTAGNATTATAVQTVLTTSYGVVTVNSDVAASAYVLDYYDNTATSKEWIKLAAADDNTVTPKTWDLAGTHNTFVNQYGNHKGKYALTVDFSDGVMDDMHIKNDTHLQKLLKYYIASGKTETVSLNLDEDANNEFKISKLSIALLQTINAAGIKVTVHACTTHGTPKIIVTQEGQTGDLATATEVPNLDNVFDASTDVYLASGTTWTWKQRTGLNQLTVDANVKSLTNEGTLTVNADNIDLSIAGKTITNAAGATMNITQVTTAKTALTNLGTINVGAADKTGAELRAYNVEIKNDATSLTAHGVINNFGVVGVSDIGTLGKFNNYGLIDVKNAGAITLLSTNEEKSNFDNHFDAATNKLGTVKIPSPTALVSVNNADANGFIKYTWDKNTKTYVTPEGNVKYNTIVVSGDIEFTEIENEIQYIEFDGTRTQVINNGYLKQLKGVIVNPGKSIIIEKGNTLAPKDGTFLGSGATVYRGGTFTHNASVVGTTASNYFGDWQTTQIVKY